MNRLKEIQRMTQQGLWDVIIIGGGATGLGIATDATSRGYSVLLLEAMDFAKGTSSRSTKLLHGGVRYLAQGNFSLVYEALHERDHLIHNAPHLCKIQPFIIPATNLFSAFYYLFGLYIYDKMAGQFGLGATHFFRKDQARNHLKGIKEEKLQFGICYQDGQFDDARLALALAMTAHDHGACLVNYMKVVNLLQDSHGHVNGVEVQDHFGTHLQSIYGKCVINATGVFTNTINTMNGDDALSVKPSQGIHLVLDKKFLPSEYALMVPSTSDGRVLFAIPWHDKVVVGTTDTPIDKVAYDPLPLEEEIDFIMKTFNEYALNPITHSDILSIFVGLRPLVSTQQTQANSKDISRSHKIVTSKSKLVCVNGGKWTTYRNMAEETINAAIREGLLEERKCQTQDLHLHGYRQGGDDSDRLCVYGSDADEILKLEQDPELAKKIHPQYPYTYAQIYWALEYEMAQTLDDVLSRRIRLLFLDAHAASEVAHDVLVFIAKHQGWTEQRCAKESDDFMKLVSQYQNNPFQTKEQ